jgi:oligoribonuclease
VTKLIVIDTETTGLGLGVGIQDESILEVGMARFDLDTFEIEDSVSVLIHDRITQGVNCMRNCSSFVYDMHQASGLWADRLVHGVTHNQADAILQRWLADQVDFGYFDKDCGPMVGSSVQFDRRFLEWHMPGVAARFHYRNIDISTIKEMCRRLNPDVYAKLPLTVPRAETHRVLSDIDDTLGELKFYVDNFLWVV